MSESETAGRVRTYIESGPSLGRIISFSDGVFAVAITLLVLSIDMPNIPQKLADRRLPEALRTSGC